MGRLRMAAVAALLLAACTGGEPEAPPPAPGARGPNLPVAVNHAMAATLDGVLYIAGGNDGDGPSAQVARLDGDRWRRLAPPPRGRSAGGLVALEGRLYLVGGGVDGRGDDHPHVYDPPTPPRGG